MTNAIRMTQLNYGDQSVAMQLMMDVLNDRITGKNLDVAKGVDDAFIARRCFAMIGGICYTDATSKVTTATVYAMRTQSKLRDAVDGVAVRNATGDWFYTEEADMDFDLLLNMYRRTGGDTDAFNTWKAAPAFPAYINAMVEQSAVH